MSVPIPVHMELKPIQCIHQENLTNYIDKIIILYICKNNICQVYLIYLFEIILILV